MALAYSISAEHLYRKLGSPQCPLLLDVCIDEDFHSDPSLVPGATRFPYWRIGELEKSLQPAPVVVVCQKGLKLSQGAAALLRTFGIDACFLEGGNQAWRDAGLPMIPADSLPALDYGKPGLFVIGGEPGFDTMACHWLIRRFVAPSARFLIVESDQMDNVAERYSAVPLVAPPQAVRSSAKATGFEGMCDEFGLRTDPLIRMAKALRTGEGEQQSGKAGDVGLVALAARLPGLYPDTLKMLDASLVLYDALYRWAADTSPVSRPSDHYGETP